MAPAEPQSEAPPTEVNGQPAHDHGQIVRRLVDARQRIKQEVGQVIVGQAEIVDHLLVGLLCRGHVLLHGVPGLGKTLIARTLADALAMEFRRIQFTPDLMPSDITGTDIIKEDHASGRHTLEFLPGPVFTNFLLADEINRTPPKTQAALLQAMQEGQVTVGRQTYSLPSPFFVVATQNPIEMEGTYPLPEAQVDRFMFNLRVGYPTIEEEMRIVTETTGAAIAKASAAIGGDEIVRLQGHVRGVPVAASVVNYATRLVAATRPGCGGPAELHKYIACGASPRASQCLILGAKARALLAGRFHVDFADVKELAAPVLRHRLVLNFHAQADKVDVEALVERLLASVPLEGQYGRKR
jgi:MoxR-like ATPase